MIRVIPSIDFVLFRSATSEGSPNWYSTHKISWHGSVGMYTDEDVFASVTLVYDLDNRAYVVPPTGSTVDYILIGR